MSFFIDLFRSKKDPSSKIMTSGFEKNESWKIVVGFYINSANKQKHMIVDIPERFRTSEEAQQWANKNFRDVVSDYSIVRSSDPIP